VGNKSTTRADILIGAQDQTGKGVQSAKQKIGGLTKAVKSYGAEMAAAYLAVRKAYKIVQDLTDAWGGQEIAVIELNNALRNTGLFTPMLSDELQDLAKQLQSTTTYGDELTLSATAMLQSLGELDEEMLKRAIPAVQDLATSLFKGDMNTAASMFAKVVGSSTNALSRYGIEIDMTGSKTEKFEEIMTKVNAKFGGRSAELADSYTGKMKQLKNAYGDLKEAMGHVIANQMEPSIPLMLDITEVMTEWINKKIALKEAYEEIKKPMQDANDQTRIEIVQAKQLMAIETLRILLADTQDAQYTVMGMDLKKMNEQRDREISRLQAVISGSERELKALMDLIAARDEDNRKKDERKKTEEEEIDAMERMIAESEEWQNTVVRSGEALDDYIEIQMSAWKTQKWVTEETEKGKKAQEDLNEEIDLGYIHGRIYSNELMHMADYTAAAAMQTDIYTKAMWRLENRARMMETELPEVKDQMKAINEQAKEMADAIEGPWSRAWETLGDSTMSGAEKIKQVMKNLFSDMFQMFGKEMLFLAMKSFVPGITFNPAAGVGYMAASAFAFASSGFVRSLKEGGNFITQGPQLLLVGDNPSGRERVEVNPLNGEGRSGGGTTINVYNYIYGSVQKEKDLAETIAREIGRQGYSVS